MIRNTKPPSTTKLLFQKIGRSVSDTVTDTAKLALKVAFITVVAVSTVAVMKNVASE